MLIVELSRDEMEVENFIFMKNHENIFLLETNSIGFVTRNIKHCIYICIYVYIYVYMYYTFSIQYSVLHKFIYIINEITIKWE